VFYIVIAVTSLVPIHVICFAFRGPHKSQSQQKEKMQEHYHTMNKYVRVCDLEWAKSPVTLELLHRGEGAVYFKRVVTRPFARSYEAYAMTETGKVNPIKTLTGYRFYSNGDILEVPVDRVQSDEYILVLTKKATDQAMKEDDVFENEIDVARARISKLKADQLCARFKCSLPRGYVDNPALVQLVTVFLKEFIEFPSPLTLYLNGGHEHNIDRDLLRSVLVGSNVINLGLASLGIEMSLACIKAYVSDMSDMISVSVNLQRVNVRTNWMSTEKIEQVISEWDEQLFPKIKSHPSMKEFAFGQHQNTYPTLRFFYHHIQFLQAQRKCKFLAMLVCGTRRPGCRLRVLYADFVQTLASYLM
jgi:hypothetical protein